MFIFVPRRYDRPKWVAPVIPKDHAFKFRDGTVVSTLYDLKQALTNIPDEILNEHVNDSRNDLADWIDACVGDHELASLLRPQKHRWGLIVNLERHLMRTLNLPDYVAARWLSTTSSPFTFDSGEVVHNLQELKDTLEKVSDETVAFHYERFPNDISLWVASTLGDYELADLLAECTNRTQMINYVADHLAMLQDAAQS